MFSISADGASAARAIHSWMETRETGAQKDQFSL